MTDITERLRAAVPTYEGTPIAWPCEVRSELLLEAAAEVERLREALKIAAGYVNGCYHAWHLTRDRAEALRDLTKIREALNDERAGELEAKP